MNYLILSTRFEQSSERRSHPAWTSRSQSVGIVEELRGIGPVTLCVQKIQPRFHLKVYTFWTHSFYIDYQEKRDTTQAIVVSKLINAVIRWAHRTIGVCGKRVAVTWPLQQPSQVRSITNVAANQGDTPKYATLTLPTHANLFCVAVTVSL